MWVDKYAPRVFTDLLSPETINRNVSSGTEPLHVTVDVFCLLSAQVATWLKGWMNDIEGHAPASHATSAPAGYTNYWNNSAKILLLCGPPGLGKTTLAHVLCSHCGFRPDEVNASDDRSAPALRSRVLAAMQISYTTPLCCNLLPTMHVVLTVTASSSLTRRAAARPPAAASVFLLHMQSVFGDKKPVCLVLDEVDGLTSEAVEELVKIIRATPDRGATSKSSDAAYRASATGDGGDGSDNEDAPSALAGKGGKKKQARRVEPQQTLRRPVICICNDMVQQTLFFFCGTPCLRLTVAPCAAVRAQRALVARVRASGDVPQAACAKARHAAEGNLCDGGNAREQRRAADAV